MGPNRLDDTPCKTYKRRINSHLDASSHSGVLRVLFAILQLEAGLLRTCEAACCAAVNHGLSHCLGSAVQGPGFRVSGLVQGPDFRVWGLASRVQMLGPRVLHRATHKTHFLPKVPAAGAWFSMRRGRHPVRLGPKSYPREASRSLPKERVEGGRKGGARAGGCDTGSILMAERVSRHCRRPLCPDSVLRGRPESKTSGPSV